MTKEEILKFLNSNPVCYLATVENGEPRVRGMALYRADDTGIIFHAGETKELVKQLQTNPKAEVCIHNADTGLQVRVRGSVEFFEDRKLKEEIIAARPFLKPEVDAAGYDSMKLFKMKGCRATAWTMADNLKPKTFVDL